jgi:hypothetical protein
VSSGFPSSDSPFTNKPPVSDTKIRQDSCERSGLLAGRKSFESALADASKAIELKNDAAICWVRKGAALKGFYHKGEAEVESAHEAFDKA